MILCRNLLLGSIRGWRRAFSVQHWVHRVFNFFTEFRLPGWINLLVHFCCHHFHFLLCLSLTNLKINIIILELKHYCLSKCNVKSVDELTGNGNVICLYRLICNNCNKKGRAMGGKPLFYIYAFLICFPWRTFLLVS